MWAETVKQRLLELQRTDPAFEQIDAPTGYRVNAPIRFEDLDAAELLLNCELPAAYRVFLMDIGNGGAGPGYGLQPFDLNDVDIDEAKRPFPFSASYRETGSREEQNDYWDRRDHGSLPLCDYGCGQFARLVLNGPFAGEVWIAYWSVDMGMQRFGNYVTEHNPELSCGDFAVYFDEWYATWLDGFEARLAEKD
ncbi:MAG: SMI1/KNR4 family protein [Pirellulaceae bacterium]